MRRGVIPKRWDPNYCHTIGIFLEKIDSSHVPVHKLRKFIEYIQYGISERATSENIGVPILRMLNLQDSSWDISDLKYIELSQKDKNSYLVQKKDILFNRTNSKELGRSKSSTD